MIANKTGHVHKYIAKKSIKIPLAAGRKTAVDLIKQRVCKCGKTQAYDLERLK